MELIQIDSDIFGDTLRNDFPHYNDDYPSLDGKYNLHLDYAGEYLRGDSWHYAMITETNSGQVVWQYAKGDPIRGKIIYPWSADSKSCYFTIINFGDRILRYDITTGELKTIFGSKQQNKLKGISFVPRNFNGVVFYDNAHDNGKQHDIYCYLSDKEKLIKINDEIKEDRFLISECGIKDSVILVCQDNVSVYNTIERRVTDQFPINNNDLKGFKSGHTYYLHKSDIVLLQLLTENGWLHYKLYYRQQSVY